MRHVVTVSFHIQNKKVLPLNANEWGDDTELQKPSKLNASELNTRERDEREETEANLDSLSWWRVRRRKPDPDKSRILPCHGSDGQSKRLERRLGDERRGAGEQ